MAFLNVILQRPLTQREAQLLILVIASLFFLWGASKAGFVWVLSTKDFRSVLRGRTTILFAFDEIESIVVGVPADLPLLLKWMKFSGNMKAALKSRSLSIFIRLKGGRRMALNFLIYAEGRALMKAFAELNSEKIVGPETYSETELKKMTVADLNKVFEINETIEELQRRKPGAS